jgi:hypothetical protein
MQLFITDKDKSGPDHLLDTIIMNIGACSGGGGGGGGTPAVTSSGGSPIPIRLIR